MHISHRLLPSSVTNVLIASGRSSMHWVHTRHISHRVIPKSLRSTPGKGSVSQSSQMTTHPAQQARPVARNTMLGFSFRRAKHVQHCSALNPGFAIHACLRVCIRKSLDMKHRPGSIERRNQCNCNHDIMRNDMILHCNRVDCTTITWSPLCLFGPRSFLHLLLRFWRGTPGASPGSAWAS